MPGKKKLVVFTFLIIVPLICILYCYQDGKQRLSYLRVSEGIVIDQVLSRTRNLRHNFDVLRPQLRFYVHGKEYIFVDKGIQLETGSNVTVAYDPQNPYRAYVYNFRHWINLGFIVPTIIISSFVFSIIWISISKYPKKKEILPSNTRAL